MDRQPKEEQKGVKRDRKRVYVKGYLLSRKFIYGFCG